MLNFFLPHAALKSPKPAEEAALAVTAPVTAPVVGKKAGIYVYSMLFRRFFSDIPKYLQYKKREELYNNSFITGRFEVLFKDLVILGILT